MEHITLNIEGMTCQGCVNSVTKVLEPIPGVHKVAVTLTPGQANIDYDAAQTTPQQFRQAIVDAGFDVAD